MGHPIIVEPFTIGLSVPSVSSLVSEKDEEMMRKECKL